MKTVVKLKVDVLVEVDGSEDYYATIERANRKVQQHIVEGNGFLPFRSEVDMVFSDTTLVKLSNSITIQPGSGWF